MWSRSGRGAESGLGRGGVGGWARSVELEKG